MKNITFRRRGGCGKLSHPPRSAPPPLLLFPRAAEMGRRTLFGAVPLVPRVRAASHYGSVWKVRAAAVVVLWLWVLWRGTGKGPTAVMPVAMLAIGWTYSASGHASAWGRLQLGPAHRRPARGVHRRLGRRPPGAGHVGTPLFLTGHDRAYALETAERLSWLAGLALLCVVPTGIYNAVTQIGFLSAMGDRLRAALAAQAGRRARHGGARRHQPISRPACAAGLGPGVAHLPSHSIGRSALPSCRHRGIAPGRLGPRVHGASDRREPAAPGIAGRHAPCRRGRGLDSPC